MSRYEDKVLIPGFEEACSLEVTTGGGGGGGNGEEDVGVGGGVGRAAAVGVGMVAFFFKCWILSLYACFSSLISLNPSLLERRSANAIGISLKGVSLSGFLGKLLLIFL